MTPPDAILNHLLDQMARLYRVLAVYKSEAQSSRQYGLLTEGLLEELHRLQAEVDKHVGTEEAVEATAPLWIRVTGPSILSGSSPTSILTAILDALRKSIQAAAEFLATGTLTVRPTAELKRACDLRAVAFLPGSLRIGLTLPDLPELERTREGSDLSLPEEALRRYLSVAGWAASQESEESLRLLVPDLALRRLLLTELLRLVPRVRGEIDTIEISGMYMPARRAATLTRPTRERLASAIDNSIEEVVETHVGLLREIDLDEYSFIIRAADGAPQEIRCSFSAEIVESAKDALDKKVQVTGIRPRTTGRRPAAVRLQVTRLEVLEDDPS